MRVEPNCGLILQRDENQERDVLISYPTYLPYAEPAPLWKSGVNIRWIVSSRPRVTPQEITPRWLCVSGPRTSDQDGLAHPLHTLAAIGSQSDPSRLSQRQ